MFLGILYEESIEAVASSVVLSNATNGILNSTAQPITTMLSTLNYTQAVNSTYIPNLSTSLFNLTGML